MCLIRVLVEPLAQVMAKLGVVKGMVVFGQDKLDEISMSAPTSVCEIKDGWFQSYEITPEQFGYTRCSKDDLVGGTPAENAEITKAILKGEEEGAEASGSLPQRRSRTLHRRQGRNHGSRCPHGRRTDRQRCGTEEIRGIYSGI